VLADMVGNLLDVKIEDKQDLLETFELRRRLDKVLEMLGERVGVLRISKEIGEKTRKQFDERQREHVLREQMRQIQKELGEDEEGGPAEIAELKKAIDEAGMPEETHKHALKELKRLQRMGEGSAEGSMLRTYLEWLSELPWRVRDEKPIDIAKARQVLDEDHFGLDKVKRRILEHLAARSSASSARRESARPRSASPSRAPPTASSSASRSAVSTTRPRSAATAAPTSARCPAR
jgi:ATP-dependent Lon protease